jgi:hypothetical protein
MASAARADQPARYAAPAAACAADVLKLLIAVAREEAFRGRGCIAIPVTVAGLAEPAAVSVSTSREALTQNWRRLLSELVEARSRLQNPRLRLVTDSSDMNCDVNCAGGSVTVEVRDRREETVWITVK